MNKVQLKTKIWQIIGQQRQYQRQRQIWANQKLQFAMLFLSLLSQPGSEKEEKNTGKEVRSRKQNGKRVEAGVKLDLESKH